MRRQDWPARLAETLREARACEFAWGRHDCFLHAGAVAEALTGRDPTAAMRGRYGSYAQGLRVARRLFGIVGLAEFADLHWRRQPIAFALRGDWAAARVPGVEGWALLIVDGPVLRDARDGVLPLTEARISWRVE